MQAMLTRLPEFADRLAKLLSEKDEFYHQVDTVAPDELRQACRANLKRGAHLVRRRTRTLTRRRPQDQAGTGTAGHPAAVGAAGVPDRRDLRLLGVTGAGRARVHQLGANGGDEFDRLADDRPLLGRTRHRIRRSGRGTVAGAAGTARKPAAKYLEAKGFKEVNTTNYWNIEFEKILQAMIDNGDAEAAYRGLNTNWLDPETGQVFEIQFHTRDSFDAKQSTHPQYEEKRVPNQTPANIEAAEAIMREIFGDVPIPAGAIRL
ncbi:hypothetical protein [Amycolatopsis sp. NPDC059657]|uniref:hypothetical protein n=1 Tax=Amycolatopsis sp. NPDC059657 TaxID=3346899 RepID=UPI0036718F80